MRENRLLSALGGIAQPTAVGPAIVVLAGALLALVALAMGAYRAWYEREAAAAWVQYTEEVRQATWRVLSAAQDHELGTRGYALTGDERSLATEEAADEALPRALGVLESLVAQNPGQRKRVARLAPILREMERASDRIIAARQTGGLEAASRLMSGGGVENLMPRLRSDLQRMVATEEHLLRERLALLGRRESRVRTFGALLALAGVITLAGGGFALVRALRGRQVALARLAAERSYAADVFDTVREPLLVYDSDLRLVETNAAYGQVFGAASSVAKGRLLTDFAAGAPWLSRLVALLQEALTSGKPFDGFEIESPVEGAGMRQVLLYGRRLEGLERPMVLLVAHDVTDERRVEQLEVERLALERTNRELQEFAYVASHDLQEPLRKMRAFSERLTSKYVSEVPEEARDYLTRISQGAERMQRLIDDLLTFSRLTTKAAPFVRVDLAELAREVVSDLEPRLAASGGRIELGPLPTIEGDRTQMRQLLQNLLSNALKFRRPDAAPLVRVSASLPRDGEPCCEIRVADNGIGFDEKYLDRIFTIFQRLHGRDEYEGTGLGLAICRKVVERHRGRITARSAPGEGATFIVSIPLRQPAVLQAA